MKDVVLITGAGIGIGRATAKAFAKAGYHVVATDVLADEGASVVAEIVADGGTAEFHMLDVRSTEAADAVVAAAEAKHGAIDVIVANAGIAHRVPLDQMTDAKWDHTFDIDLKGIFRVVRPALAGMKARKKGAVVALSSIMGVAYGWDEHVHYSAAKSGVVGLVRGLAVELAKEGIRVNGISAGPIRTLSASGVAGFNQILDHIAAHSPMRRNVTADEVGDVCAFLCSPMTRGITGSTIYVDNGFHIMGV